MAVLFHYLRFVFVAIAFVLVLASLNNVFGDNAELFPVAKQEACPSGLCALTRLERTPFAQTFHYTTPGDEPIVVRCARSAIFFGDYSCKRQ